MASNKTPKPADISVFVPLADDKFAAVHNLLDVATVKPSGYLLPRGTFPAELLPQVTKGILAYYAEQGRPVPVIYTRPVGGESWTAQDVTPVSIPDALPADFS